MIALALVAIAACGASATPPTPTGSKAAPLTTVEVADGPGPGDIRAAVRALPGAGGVVRVPAGVYVFDESADVVRVPGSNVVIECEPGAVFFNPNPALNGPLLSFEGGSNVAVRGCAFVVDTPADVAPKQFHREVVFDTVDGATVDECSFHFRDRAPNQTQHMLVFKDSTNIRVTRSDFLRAQIRVGPKSADAVAVEDVRIENNRFVTPRRFAVSAVMVAPGQELNGVYIRDNIIVGIQSGAFHLGVDGSDRDVARVSNVHVERNTIRGEVDDVRSAWVMQIRPGIVSHDWFFRDNTINVDSDANHHLRGISIDTGTEHEIRRLTIGGNTIGGSNGARFVGGGISLNASVAGLVIRDNMLTDTAGIRLLSRKDGVRSALISGNRIDSFSHGLVFEQHPNAGHPGGFVGVIVSGNAISTPDGFAAFFRRSHFSKSPFGITYAGNALDAGEGWGAFRWEKPIVGETCPSNAVGCP